MTVCLQGGGELSPGCRAMDRELLARTEGPVVVTTLAAARGHDYHATNAEALAHFRALGATEVLAAPDVREDPAGALSALGRARLIVLPGGSPARLLDLLRSTAVGQLVVDLVADGGAVMGASAGAMVLGSWTVLPDRPGLDGSPGLARGLGIVPGTVVVPHWDGGREGWLGTLAQIGESVEALGLPEESGVLLAAGTLTALGQAPSRLISRGQDLAPGTSVAWEHR